MTWVYAIAIVSLDLWTWRRGIKNARRRGYMAGVQYGSDLALSTFTRAFNHANGLAVLADEEGEVLSAWEYNRAIMDALNVQSDEVAR